MKAIAAEIITIGDEILFGQILDTNTQWISLELDKIGVTIVRKTSVGDNRNDILNVFAEAANRANIVLVTGGLGPTNDDITKSCFCQYFNCGEAIDETALASVTDFFKKRGRELTPMNRLQASLPTACVAILNYNGTAPGMWFETDETIFVSMPGVPFEMKEMMTTSVIPAILKKFNTPIIHHQWIKTVGIGESYIADLIKDIENSLPSYIKLAYLPSLGAVRLRLTCKGVRLATLQEEGKLWANKIVPLLSEHIYALEDISFVQYVANSLLSAKLTLATAESCTGGYIAHLLTTLPGSSQYFKGSIVAYHNDIKHQLLGIPIELIAVHGAVSEEVVREMAIQVRKIMGTTIGVACSGVAGPEGGSIDKPVGTVWIAFSDGSRTVTKKLMLGNLRENNIKLTCVNVLNLIRKNIG